MEIFQDTIRLSKDLEEAKQLRNVYISFPDDELTHFIVKLCVDSGIYHNVFFRFKFDIPEDWPNSPPKVLILDKIWHPNIELVKDGHPETGRLCLDVLKDNYKATMTIGLLIESIKYLLVNLNPNNAYNIEAATEKNKNYDDFMAHVKKYISEMQENEPDDDDE